MVTRFTTMALLAAVSLPATTLAQRPSGDAASFSASLGTEYRVTPNITYQTSSGMDLNLDVYRPARATGPLPTVLFFHGGGYRLGANLFCGKHLYVDDLVTADTERSKSYGRELLAWLRALAVKNDCDVFHLDSGVQRKRAHAFYLREGMELSSYHFSERLKPR